METILTNYLFQHSKYKEMFHAQRWTFMQCCPPRNFLMHSCHKLCNVDAVTSNHFFRKLVGTAANNYSVTLYIHIQ